MFTIARHRPILPPHILDQIARNGSTKQRSWALDTLKLDHALRTKRLIAPRIRAMWATATPGVAARAIHDAQHRTHLPGKLARAEGQPAVGDQAVDEAYEYLGATYDFFWKVYHRNSIDDAGMALSGTVHYDKDYDNAFWDGSQMVFGDGDGELFNRFTIAIDIVGHELAHGVTEHEANLDYQGQAGALNESLSDVFGSMIKQHHAQQAADKADWLIGHGLLTGNVKGKALRSMSAPGTAYDDPVLGKDPQPADMANYVNTMEDYGGVHINSGIPNRAFYLLAMQLGGFAWEKAGLIWYETLVDKKLSRTATFKAFANRTFLKAGSLFGAGSTEQNAVKKAWTTVGVSF